MILDKKDTNQLEKIGIRLVDFERQLELISRGVDIVKIQSAATYEKGIIKLADSDLERYMSFYENPSDQLEVVKFVPASGAATRMFKDLILFHNEKEHNVGSETFFQNIEKFPFYKKIQKSLTEALSNGKTEKEAQIEIVDQILHAKKYSFAHLPKGLIPFHDVDGEIRTAFEEHYREAIGHSSDKKNVCLHFTVSLIHRDLIKDLIAEARQKLNQPPITVSYSLQSNATDTVALNLNDEIVRDNKGHMVFRPGGHGSLLNNLNNIHTDLIFIRNIDNVIPQENKENEIQYEKVMAGFLMEQKEKRDAFLIALEDNPENDPDGYQKLVGKAFDFIQSSLKQTCKPFVDGEDKVDYIRKSLNRPMRICGMVKNQGEPGGGPFFVEKDGNVSLQIIESSQIDKSDEEQLRIMNSSTHFNPVDLVCATRDHHAEKYNLMGFRDVETSFIADKTYNGKPIKALEWPGLWNGAMFNWITFFMEIPLSEFNPVKTVNDLLRKNHQPSL